jgi:hypothetical protein
MYCPSLWKSVHIDTDGYLTPCCLFVDKGTKRIKITDVTNIDSFVEVINEINAVNAANFNAIYAKKNTSTQAPNGTATAFPFVNAVKVGSEQVYLNGLLLEAGDYTPNTANGEVTGVTFGVAPATTDKVVFYGVYGGISTITF